MNSPARGDRATAAALAALALVAFLSSLGNGFVYDDIPIIVDNPAVHGLGEVGRIWTSGYWPAGLLYRPLTIQLFNLEWAMGGGAPLVFHVVSLLLFAAVTVLVYRLASRVLPPLGATLAAALFAAHPVHTEAVASLVGQSELLATLFAVVAVERYMAWRTEGTLGLGRRLALGGLTLLAIFSKETGYVTPLLLGAVELTLFRRPRKTAAGVFWLQALAVAAGLLIRVSVLGSLTGEVPAAALRGLGLGQRAVGMLAVVPEWVRLLVWPVHLQAEYGPAALSLTDASLLTRLLGANVLLLAGAFLVYGLKRWPVVSLDVLWVVIALAPVSNVLSATGLVLAERTLFLPSVGAMLLLGALVESLRVSVARAGSLPRALLSVVLIAVVVAGAVHASERSMVWRSDDVFFRQLVLDAPTTYRARFAASKYWAATGNLEEAEIEGRAAVALFRNDPAVLDHLGQLLRREGKCAEAIPILADGVRIAPDQTSLRSRLIECLLETGDSASARARAAEGVAAGQTEFSAVVQRLSPR